MKEIILNVAGKIYSGEAHNRSTKWGNAVKELQTRKETVTPQEYSATASL